MDKYYTPDISEFFVGFEFESNYVLSQPYTKRYDDGTPDWYVCTLSPEDHGWFWDSYENDAYEAEFRVKYLDRSDIESLGFKLIEGDKLNSTETSPYYSWTFQKKAYPDLNFASLEDQVIQLRYNISAYYNGEDLAGYEHNVSIRYKNKIESFEDKQYSTYVFIGIIKNKSELIKLLKQLNIE